MTPKRFDRVAPPPAPVDWDFRYANSHAVRGWEDLCRQAAANLRRAYQDIIQNPTPSGHLPRHHRLRPPLDGREFKGVRLPQWQYEVTGGGRLWYLVDAERRTIWLWYAGTGHPKPTE